MSKTLELFESIQNHLNESNDKDLDNYWQKNYQKIINFVDEAGPEYIADLIYDGDIEMFNQNTGKQVALDLLYQLGIKELENELKSLNESYNLNIFDTRPCPSCGSREFKRVIDKEDSDGTQHFHYACPKCGYTEDEEEYNPSIDELNLKIFKNFFNNYINKLDIDDNILKKVNDCAKQELKDIGNSGSDIENTFEKWDKDYWMTQGLYNQESSYSDYASILERKYNLTKDESLFLAYCINCIRGHYLPSEQETKQEAGRKEIKRKTYDGDEYIATVIAEMIDIDGGPYHDYITQVDEIEYDDGSIEYHYRTSHSDGSITKEELDNYKNTK